MGIRAYDEMNALQRDIMKEIGSIGTGNAATALSSLLAKTIKMTVPDVKIMGYNEAVAAIGTPEEIISGVLVHMTGDINGIMLYIQRMEFINLVLKQFGLPQISDYTQLEHIQISAIKEISNIIISSYVNALTKLMDMSVSLSVPSISVNMLGAIVTVPMAELGYQTDKAMMIDGTFICEGEEVSSKLLMMPNMDSLNNLLEKLGNYYE